MRALTICGATAMVALAIAPPASAGTATLGTSGETLKVTTAEFVATAGERNSVDVQVSAAEVTFRDTRVSPKAGSGCAALLDTVRCALPQGGPTEFGFLVVLVRGGDGDDRIVFKRPSGAPSSMPLVFAGLQGGDGADEVGVESSAVTEDSKPPFVLGIAEGGPGDDTVTGGEGSDLLAGGPGRDVLRGGAGDDALHGDSESLVDLFIKALTDPEASTDSLPTPPPETPGDDTLDGGDGEDVAGYEGRQVPVRVDLSDPGPDGSPGESDTLTGIEDVIGGAKGNELIGDGGPNQLTGGASGADRLSGGGGDDSLYGAAGSNILAGGDGADTLAGPGKGSTCGAGTDHVAPTSSRALDGLALRRDCELLDIGAGAALRLVPIRRSSTLQLPMVTFLTGGFAPGDPLGAAFANDFGEPSDTTARVKVSKPGGKALGGGSVKIPEGTKSGRESTARIPLTKKGRRSIRSLKRVRVTVSGLGGTTAVDLPTRR